MLRLSEHYSLKILLSCRAPSRSPLMLTDWGFEGFGIKSCLVRQERSESCQLVTEEPSMHREDVKYQYGEKEWKRTQ